MPIGSVNGPGAASPSGRISSQKRHLRKFFHRDNRPHVFRASRHPQIKQGAGRGHANVV
jgi:hypothetical protein